MSASSLSVCIRVVDAAVFNCLCDRNHPSGKRVYFILSFAAYIIGLATTIAVMHVFNAAQPALLYLVPCCVGLPLLQALIRREVIPLFK